MSGSGAPGEITVNAKRSGRAVRLCVEGELDIATADALRAAIEQLRRHRRPTVLDLQGVAFIDGRSAALVVSTVSRARTEGWDVAVEDMSEPVRRVLRLTGLGDDLAGGPRAV